MKFRGFFPERLESDTKHPIPRITARDANGKIDFSWQRCTAPLRPLSEAFVRNYLICKKNKDANYFIKKLTHAASRKDGAKLMRPAESLMRPAESVTGRQIDGADGVFKTANILAISSDIAGARMGGIYAKAGIDRRADVVRLFEKFNLF